MAFPGLVEYALNQEAEEGRSLGFRSYVKTLSQKVIIMRLYYPPYISKGDQN